MAYDPADLRLPPWLLAALALLIRIRLPLAPHWRFGMTRPGVIFVAALIGIWAAAFYSGNNLLYLCGALLTAILMAAVWQAVQRIRTLPAGLLAGMPAMTCGESRVMSEAFASPGMSAMIGLEWCNGAGRHALMLRCEAQGVMLQGRLRPERRGLFENRQVQIESAAPLGMFVISLCRDFDTPMVVLPVPVSWHGGEFARSAAEGGEWRDLRSYLPGDALSRVH